ncbi:MAG: hypothetical protein Q9217_002315 [Psora testacea]
MSRGGTTFTNPLDPPSTPSPFPSHYSYKVESDPIILSLSRSKATDALYAATFQLPEALLADCRDERRGPPSRRERSPRRRSLSPPRRYRDEYSPRKDDRRERDYDRRDRGRSRSPDDRDREMKDVDRRHADDDRDDGPNGDDRKVDMESPIPAHEDLDTVAE